MMTETSTPDKVVPLNDEAEMTVTVDGHSSAPYTLTEDDTFLITKAAEEGLKRSDHFRNNLNSRVAGSSGSVSNRFSTGVTSAATSVAPSDIWPDDMSCHSSDDTFALQLEHDRFYQGPLRSQSRRISKLITSRTELSSLDPVIPDPPKKHAKRGNGGKHGDDDEEEEETSGIKYWLQEIQTAKEHGGDYRDRNLKAARAALGSVLTFSVLVFPKQQILGAVWIGNIFMHCSISTSFGASLQSVLGYGTSILLTTLISLPVGLFLSVLGENSASILLPFVSFILTFIIMSCPQFTSRNLMILVMYIVIATNVRERIEIWQPLGWVASYWIGLFIALLMNAIPLLSNYAARQTSQNLNRLEEDLTMLLMQCKAYSDHTASKPSISRAATASIELLQRRITKTVKTLKSKLPATAKELSWQFRNEAISDLTEWVHEAEALLAPLKSLRTALVQRVLGEEYAMHSSVLDQQKAIIREEISPARDRMVDAMISSIAVCHAWADPSAYRTVLPDVQEELAISIEECRAALQRAMIRSSAMLDTKEGTSIALFAHLTRRMTAFNAIFELGEHILTYLQKHTWEAQQERRFYDETTSHKRRKVSGVLLSCLYGFKAYLEQKWLWHNPDSFRLALKTAVGMCIASLFVSMNYLWNISQPFGVWPGLTIASVNLASTGSSFHKASDRLFGTLLAAAYALLVSDLFPGTQDYVKIPAIGFFTFMAIYLRNSEHAYKYTYAATSIGSMLYGSIKNDFNIAGYIPKRIELIFTGVTIFSIVELLLFPRSSRKMVESFAFQHFLTMRDFLKQAVICTKRMEEYLASSDADSFLRIGDDSMDLFQLEKLATIHKIIKAENSKLKKELDPGLQEPCLGLSLPLNPESFRGLAKEQGDCEVQALLLVKSLKALGKLYQEPEHPIRKLNWPKMHSKFLKDAVDRIDNACEWLKSAYPDGRIRAQRGNSVKAVTAAAAFRGFEDVRIRTITKWTDNYHQFTLLKESDMPDPASIMALGTSSTMSILELCRRLQKAGRHVEDVAHHFPASSRKEG